MELHSKKHKWIGAVSERIKSVSVYIAITQNVGYFGAEDCCKSYFASQNLKRRRIIHEKYV